MTDYESISWWRKPVKAFGQTHQREPGSDTTLCGKKIPTNKKTDPEGSHPCTKCDRLSQRAVPSEATGGHEIDSDFKGTFTDWNGNSYPAWAGEGARYVANVPPGFIVFDHRNRQLTVLSQGLGSTYASILDPSEGRLDYHIAQGTVVHVSPN